MIRLRPQEKVAGIKPNVIQLFLHWLYTNRFSESTKKAPSFGQLLELYFLGHAYKIAVLKNVVISQLIKKCGEYWIPKGCTRKIYRFTELGDQLRKLWVDVYVWEIPGDRFEIELESGKLDPIFLRDLARAQTYRIRDMQEKHDHGVPPYHRHKSAYHKRDPSTGLCCSRPPNSDEKYNHLGFFQHENAALRNVTKRLELKLKALQRKESENTILKRNLAKLQQKLRKTETKLMRHVAIDHSKLFQKRTFDNPEIENPDVMRPKKLVNGLRD